MSFVVSISINRQGYICATTKRGGVGLDPSMYVLSFVTADSLFHQWLIYLQKLLNFINSVNIFI